MARTAISINIGGPLGSGRYTLTQIKGILPLSTTAGVASGTLLTNATAAMGVLVADGATPTQAHVNTMNTAYGLLATAVTATTTATSGGHVIIDYDTTACPNANALREAVERAVTLAIGSGLAVG